MSSYVEKNLMDDETIVHQVRLHPIILLIPSLTVSLLAGSLSVTKEIPLVYAIVGLLLVGALFRLTDRLILYLTSEFAVTTKRVLGKTGLISISTSEIVLAKVEAIRLSQTILGRIFNFGNVEVTGTGGTEEILRFIPDPIYFSKCVQEQLAQVEDGQGRPEAGVRL